jgi:membrane-associated phospholipid phosphatase
MPPLPRNPGVRPLPHEFFFGLLFVSVFVSLMVAGRPDRADLLFFASFLFLQLLVVAFSLQRTTPARWRLRLLLYPLLINVVYIRIPDVVAALGLNLVDGALLRIDETLLGGDLGARLQPFVSPLRTEVLAGAYLFYLPYFGVSQLLYLLDEIELATRFYIGFFTVFAVGFAGYIFVPAHGPYLAFPHLYTVPLVGGVLFDLMAAVVRAAGVRTDAFPSLHVAVPAFILAFDFLHKRRRFWICLVPSALLWFSTLYLRYHYAVDLLAGFLLAAAALALAERWPCRAPALPGRQPPDGGSRSEEAVPRLTVRP